MLPLRSSWPGLSRPSTSLSCGNQDVDARHKAGHDGVRGEVERLCDCPPPGEGEASELLLCRLTNKPVALPPDLADRG
ncbi:hypothetical protein CWS35_11705 [Bradyrhizobium sp. SK17]|nr:hypothetical protein CWS35_11705 [Bradyrhizobium sp. SK17]